MSLVSQKAEVAGIREPGGLTALVDRGEDAFLGVRVDHGTDPATGIFRGGQFEALRRLDQAVQEKVVDRFEDDDAGTAAERIWPA